MKKLDCILEITSKEWEKLSWEKIDVSKGKYIGQEGWAMAETWAIGYNYIGKAKIEGTVTDLTEYVMQKDGQIYVLRSGIIAPVTISGKNLIAGIGKSETYADQAEEIFKPENHRDKLWKAQEKETNNRIYVFDSRDLRMIRFFKINGCSVEYPLINGIAYTNADEKLAKMAAEKYGYTIPEEMLKTEF